ncbi:MAG: UDP-N-acetylmuramoyl-L-alanine--D-glutamate ligase [Clostridia bacterium]|nr:UDP-N-acetylmuramoyl-L-alanine--D-glutamate ligase [Clostridia bacterium]
MDLTGKKVLVFGTGISGIGAAKCLEEMQAFPVLYDGNEKLDCDEIRQKGQFKETTQIFTGTFPEEQKEQIELFVISPGISFEHPFACEFKQRGIPVWSEVELAYQLDQGDLIAITGTNGKTTTTTLTGEILSAYNKQTIVVGNIGKSYTREVRNTVKGSVTVAEISSFQLETIQDFHPKISAILNITPDHLDRHHTYENYIKEKEKIALNQTKDDSIILNYEDEETRKFGELTKAQPVYFSSAHVLKDGIYLKDDVIYKAVNGTSERLLSIYETKLLGIHSYENIMAAIAIADAYGVGMDLILSVVKEFRAVEHRIEFVATKNGVDYYNDSKGTNVDAAIKGIQAMVKPTYLIGGGYNKKASYEDWILSFDGKVKELILMGQTKEAIAECARSHHFDAIYFAESMEDAVKHCADEAVDGDAVLLSPACASWGMFKNYEERGRIFKDLVNKLGE